MQTTPRRRAPRALRRLGAFLVLIAACDRAPDVVAPTSQAPPVSRALMASDAELVESADYYAADVTLHFTGGQAPAYTGDGPQRRFDYLHERTLPYGGVWETRASFSSYLPLGANGGDTPRPDIGRVETTDNGSYVRVYDRSGALMMERNADTSGSKATYNQLASGYVPPYNGGSGGDGPIVPQEPMYEGTAPAAAMTSAARARSPRGTVPANTRAWLDDIFVTPKSRARVEQRLAAAFQRAAGKSGRTLYRRAGRNDRVQEVDVDSASGAVEEVRLSERGTLRQRITYTYTPITTRFLVRTGTRVEIAPPGGSGPPMVLEQTLRNVRLEKRRAE